MPFQPEFANRIGIFGNKITIAAQKHGILSICDLSISAQTIDFELEAQINTGLAKC